MIRELGPRRETEGKVVAEIGRTGTVLIVERCIGQEQFDPDAEAVVLV